MCYVEMKRECFCGVLGVDGVVVGCERDEDIPMLESGAGTC